MNTSLSNYAHLCNKQIRYVHARPDGYSPIIVTGVVMQATSTQIYVKPDDPHLVAKWRNPETDIIWIADESTIDTTPALKPFHITALLKAQVARTANPKPSGGWCKGTEVGGWKTADQLVVLGYFETSLDSKRSDLLSRRYRITSAGIEILNQQKTQAVS